MTAHPHALPLGTAEPVSCWPVQRTEGHYAEAFRVFRFPFADAGQSFRRRRAARFTFPAQTHFWTVIHLPEIRCREHANTTTEVRMRQFAVTRRLLL